MPGISKSVCKKIVLSLIGGIPINGVPTTTVLGTSVVSELSLGGLVSLASSVAATATSLSTIAQNPLGAVTSTLTDTIGNLTKENFSQLDSTLSSVASNPSLSDAYSNFKKSLGGGDGVGGAYTTIQKFKQHTDRLSGQVLSAESNLSQPLTNSQNKPGGRTT